MTELIELINNLKLNDEILIEIPNISPITSPIENSNIKLIENNDNIDNIKLVEKSDIIEKNDIQIPIPISIPINHPTIKLFKKDKNFNKKCNKKDELKKIKKGNISPFEKNDIKKNDINDIGTVKKGDMSVIGQYLETKIKLKHILDMSKINHTIEIMNQTDLKNAHMYCKIYGLSGQISGPLIENYIKNKYGMKKNKASFCTGDLYFNEQNIEIKVSNGGKDNNKFNYVQLRMNHNCIYILTAYLLNNDNLNDLGELFIFKLNKNDLKNLILKYGNYAHGTIQKLGAINIEDLNDITNDKEYSIRPKYGDKCWYELLNFRIDEIGI